MPEPAIAGVAADAAISETSSARPATYEMNRGFKSLPSNVMRPRRRGLHCRPPSLPPSPRALVRVVKAGWVVKRRGEPLVVRAASATPVLVAKRALAFPSDESKARLFARRRQRRTRHTRLRRDHG